MAGGQTGQQTPGSLPTGSELSMWVVIKIFSVENGAPNN